MGRKVICAALAVGAVTLWLAPSAMARQARSYEVTIENLTTGQPLTPPVAATHSGRDAIFRVGGRASSQLQQVAENGNNGPLIAALDASRRVRDVEEGPGGPLVPDGRPGSAMFDDVTSFEIEGGRGANRISFASMLICTNDGFTGVNGLRLPTRVGHSTVAFTNGYDAGTEANTEDFADIVPPCQSLIGVSSGEEGTATSDPALFTNGLIVHHPNISGRRDLRPDVHGWSDPVARITVEAIG
jgi:hypothetical protein